MSNAIASIIEQLEKQKVSIERALQALREIEGITGPAPTPTKRRGRPPVKKNEPLGGGKEKTGTP